MKSDDVKEIRKSEAKKKNSLESWMKSDGEREIRKKGEENKKVG